MGVYDILTVDMLDQNDINQISKVLTENNKELRSAITAEIKENNRELRAEIKENNKELTKEIVGQVVIQVGEFINDNVLTEIQAVEDRLNAKIDKGIDQLNTRINMLPKVEDLDRPVARAKGDVVTMVRNEDKKVNLHIEFGKKNKTLSDEQWGELHKITVFPTVEI